MSKAANLALEIANDLLTEGGSGRKGDHLQIANGVPPNDVYLAGWCESAIVERIAAILEPHLVGEWLPIESAPVDVLIQIMEQQTGWVGTGIRKVFTDADNHTESYCQVLHYNGEILVQAFYATHWQPVAPPKGEQSA